MNKVKPFLDVFICSGQVQFIFSIIYIQRLLFTYPVCNIIARHIDEFTTNFWATIDETDLKFI